MKGARIVLFLYIILFQNKNTLRLGRKQMLCFINANKNEETTELTHNIYVVCHAFGPLSQSTFRLVEDFRFF